MDRKRHSPSGRLLIDRERGPFLEGFAKLWIWELKGSTLERGRAHLKDCHARGYRTEPRNARTLDLIRGTSNTWLS